MKPMFPYYGGKEEFSGTILKHLPRDAEIYVEPYCGAAAVFFRKEWRERVEILNDVDEGVINFYKCIQDEKLLQKLHYRLLYTPHAKADFIKAWKIRNSYDLSINDATRAWAFWISQHQSFLSDGKPSWTCSLVRDSRAFNLKPLPLDKYHSRLEGVTLLNLDALEVIKKWDGKGAFFYLDPPYTMRERVCHGYKHEVKSTHHERLVDVLLSLKGRCVLSGYRNQVYKRLEEDGWSVYEYEYVARSSSRMKSTTAGKKCGRDKVSGIDKRIEVLWIKS